MFVYELCQKVQTILNDPIPVKEVPVHHFPFCQSLHPLNTFK